MDKTHILNVFNELIDKYSKMKKKYDIFLSHKQAESQDRVKVYKCYLEKYKYKCFLDRDSKLKDSDWTPEKVIEIVSSCSHLVFFITNTVLDASWCQWELYIALRCKIPITLIIVDPWPNKPIILKNLKIPYYIKDAFKMKPLIDNRYKTDKCVDNLIKRIKNIK